MALTVCIPGYSKWYLCNDSGNISEPKNIHRTFQNHEMLRLDIHNPTVFRQIDYLQIEGRKTTYR